VGQKKRVRKVRGSEKLTANNRFVLGSFFMGAIHLHLSVAFAMPWSAAVVAFSIKNRLRLRCSDFETFLGLHTKCSSMVMMINRFC